jgi:hypothetical protein
MKIAQTVYVRGHNRPDHIGVIVKIYSNAIKIKLNSGTWTLSKGQLKANPNHTPI